MQHPHSVLDYFLSHSQPALKISWKSASSGWPGAGKTKGSRGFSPSLHISGVELRHGQARGYQTHTHTLTYAHTHARARGQTDAGNDNTRWPKLAPCKNYELTKICEICKKNKTSAVRYITMVSLCNAINNAFDIHAISLWLLFIISSHGYICRVTGRMITDGSLAQWTWDANLLLW